MDECKLMLLAGPGSAFGGNEFGEERDDDFPSIDFVEQCQCELMIINIYKLGDIGITSNMIGSLSLTNGHCPPPGRWIMKQWPA